MDQSSNLVCFLTHYPFSTLLIVFMVAAVKQNARVCTAHVIFLCVPWLLTILEYIIIQYSLFNFCSAAMFHLLPVLLCSGLYAAMSHNLICSSKVQVLFLLSLILYESRSCLTIHGCNYIFYYINFPGSSSWPRIPFVLQFPSIDHSYYTFPLCPLHHIVPLCYSIKFFL